jgi:hypothetical protein
MSFATKRPSATRTVETLSELVRGDAKPVRITLDLEPELYRRFKHKAIDKRMSLAEILREQIVKLVDAQD